MLLDAGADVNKTNYKGQTPLLFALNAGHEAVVRGLVEAGADVNKADDEGWVPLAVAANYNKEGYYKSRKLMELLQFYGADVNKIKQRQSKATPAPVRYPPKTGGIMSDNDSDSDSDSD